MPCSADLAATAPLDFAAQLTAGLAGLLGSNLAGAYLHGSAVLGGWTASRSDTDVLFVVADRLGDDQIQAAGTALLEAAPLAPGRRGLECSVVTASAAAMPGPPWPFLLHVGEREGEPELITGVGHPGDPDLLMHYTVIRAAGAAVAGPPPRALIGTVPRTQILNYLAGELGWGLAYGPESYGVLNACRALVYLRSGEIVSKVAGGRAALGKRWGPDELISGALDQQIGQDAERPPSLEAVSFVSKVAAKLSAAAGAPPRLPPA
jgi:Aminoglycoside adenylyltransferase, C-terminal domain